MSESALRRGRSRGVFTLGALAITPVLAFGSGCGGVGESKFDAGGASSGGAHSGGTSSGGLGGIISAGGAGGSGAGPCVNLECDVVACSGATKTTLSGTVYAPEGTLPLYNVIVYVPNAPLDPVPHGASCDQCGSAVSGDPVATALTDTKGQFVLEDVPVGDNIPLVLQVGKWRRQVTIPTVPQCVDTPVKKDLTRLPASKAEGDLPKIALTTGEADALECLLRKIGIADSEFTTESGTGSVNLYAGMESGHEGTDRYTPAFGGDNFTDAKAFWDTPANLMKYDLVLLSCEGSENPNNKSQAARQNVKAYLDAGGRVFASHWHNFWVESGPAPFPTMANFDHRDDPSAGDADIDQSFPKGKALADWMLNVAGSTVLGKIRISAPQATVRTVNKAQRWIYNDQWEAVQYMTQNTPMDVPAAEQCGRLVLSDIHVSSGDTSAPGEPYPQGCTTNGLTPEEKALIFMLFDLSACITPDDDVPVPPPVH